MQDTFGPIDVPADRYWGAQTQRSLTNFKIGGDDCTMPIEVVKGFGILKKCAAKINVANGTLDAVIGEKIIQVSQEIIDGKLDDHFPLVLRAVHVTETQLRTTHHTPHTTHHTPPHTPHTTHHTPHTTHHTLVVLRYVGSEPCATPIVTCPPTTWLSFVHLVPVVVNRLCSRRVRARRRT
jgi:hypothetical protein